MLPFLFELKCQATCNLILMAESYRQICLEGQKAWGKNYPSDQYQRSYRDKHPDYVKRDREKQWERNRRLSRITSERIVKTNAILLRPGSDGNYTLTKINREKIVNRNALMAQEQ